LCAASAFVGNGKLRRLRLLPGRSAVPPGGEEAFGRLDIVTAAGEVVERYVYDGFDRIAEHRKTTDTGATETTSYAYAPMDRTRSRTDTDG